MLILHGMIFLVLWMYRKKLDRQVLLLILCGNLLGTGLTAAGMLEKEQPVTELERRYGETTEVALEAETEEGEREAVTLQIPQADWTSEEARTMLQEKLEELDGMILGDNSSFEEVRRNLYLPEQFEDSPVTVRWSTSDSGLLDWQGRLGPEIPETGGKVILKGELMLQEESLVYTRTLRVYPGEKPEDLGELLAEETERVNENNRGTSYRLPSAANGEQITWFRKREEKGGYIAVLSLIAGALLVFFRKNEAWKREQKTQEEMKREYPEVMSRIQLLLGAGMGMRKIFEKITADYKRQLEKEKGAKRPTYEEIAGAYYEMAGGVSEQEAYENFGNRSRLPEFKNLSVLLVQNLKKGRRELGPLLEREVSAALEERRRQARAEGEKAGTRLLLPMGIMLLVVLILMVVPAFLSI